ncbi:MAG: head GIN domain-containing protein [Chloroflexota bacterium]|nr:head GIN domain-containing protein [Chloroflexota bacterium]
MNAANTNSQVRDVKDFQHVSLMVQHTNELFITQGDSESLTIESSLKIIDRIESTVENGKLSLKLSGGFGYRLCDAITTSLYRPHIAYHLNVRQLRSLEVLATAFVNIPRLETENFSLKYNGAGDISINQLTAGNLEVVNSGAGLIKLAGRVSEQKISIKGPGEYAAKELLSQRAFINIKGIGNATVWVVKELDVTISGIGGVLYLGSPEVQANISAMGSLTPLGNP